MTFDELREKWQGQPSSARLTVDADMLFKEVQRNKRWFESTVFWRDVREIVVGIAVMIFFLYHGLKGSVWELILLALLVAGVVLFLIGDRVVQKKKCPKFGESLRDCVQSSLEQVAHQIWLLKNVLWWYLLPLGVGIGVFVLGVVLDSLQHFNGKVLTISLVFLFSYLVFVFLLYWGIYWLNQRAVRKELIPRKQELEQLLDGLKSSGE